jgi:hypothetical protein
MKTFDYKGTEVTLHKSAYRNGTVALVMDNMDGELYGVVTVNLCHPLQSDSMAFLDENNFPGIGKWIESHNLGCNMDYSAASGFCTYPLYTLFI